MARQIGKMLNAREPKVVNGPEILNKYVGESEANIRKLFADAEEEQRRVRTHRNGDVGMCLGETSKGLESANYCLHKRQSHCLAWGSGHSW